MVPLLLPLRGGRNKQSRSRRRRCAPSPACGGRPGWGRAQSARRIAMRPEAAASGCSACERRPPLTQVSASAASGAIEFAHGKTPLPSPATDTRATPRLQECREPAAGTTHVRPLAWLAALALCPVAASWAQAPEPPTPATTDLDTLHVTATVLPTTAGDASHSITVLGPEELEAFRGRSLAEVLAAQAGLMVVLSARGGGFGALFLRGADASHVVVLVDGVRQNDPLSSRGSAVDLNSLSLERIERIEIVRGSASVAHAEAIAGLVHLHTRREAQGASAGVAIGGDGLRAIDAGLSGEGWTLAASDREDGDGRDGFQAVRAFDAAWDRELTPALSLRAAFGYSDSEARGFPDDSGGPHYAVIRTLDERDARARQFSLQARYRPTVGSIDAQWARYSRDGSEDSPGVAPGLRDPAGLPALAAHTDYRRDELQATWRRPLGSGGEFAAGLLHQRERGRYDGSIDYGFFQAPVAFAMERSTDAAFAELRWRHGAWT